ncbi:lmo0937 family membrane protein [Aneurinibacillus tyrosinisolvens]|uniref:lmo0937 family membrane protein n=1 Tax=Aneurinibacillus tyrosinisolvens TaxID=1443435 RepID=UPI000A7D38E5
MGILNTIALVLLVLWLIGFVMHIAGGIIHVLLVIAVVMFLINLVTGRRGRV